MDAEKPPERERKPYFPSELMAEMEREREALARKLRELPEQIVTKWWTAVQSLKAKEYLTHGVGRRLRILRRCFRTVFAICPLDRMDLLSSEELTELDTSLHAFVINVHGLLDNLAWVALFEASPTPFPAKERVGLFKAEAQKYLPPEALAFVTSQRMKDWNEKYAKDYRDALVHRIPLYVPPYTVPAEDQSRYQDLERQIFEKMKEGAIQKANALREEQETLGRILPVFFHALEDSDGIPFHPQLIADTNTVVECIRLVSPVSLS